MDESRNHSPSPNSFPAGDTGVSVYYAGSERCAPGHLWGGLRDHYLVHVVESGFGTFFDSRAEHRLGEMDVFLVCPGQAVRYRAHESLPWTYHWIGFGGASAGEVLHRLSLPHRSTVSCLRSSRVLRDFLAAHGRLKAELRGGDERHLAAAGALYSVLQLLADGLGQPVTGDSIATPPRSFGLDERGLARSSINRYVQATYDYIRKNFSRPMTIEEMADYIGVTRKHLSAVVRRESGSTPQRLLAHFRLTTAERMLKETDLSVADVARSCGYRDPLLFSRRFRDMFGCPPSAVRPSAGPQYARRRP